MEIKRNWEKLSQKEKDCVAHKIGMEIINKKIRAAEQAESMAKSIEKFTGEKPTKEIIKLVEEFLSL